MNDYIITQGEMPVDSAETWIEAEAKAQAIKRREPDRPVWIHVDGDAHEVKLP